MSGGELFQHLQKEGRFDENRTKFYVAEIILALQHLHLQDIVYCNLKPENILLNANGHIALCEFLFVKASPKQDSVDEYLASEIILDETGYTNLAEFWSLGVLIYEMRCGWSQLYAEDTEQMHKNIIFGKVRLPRYTLSAEGRNFIKEFLNISLEKRLGAQEGVAELRRHLFFSNIDWDGLAKKLIVPPFKPKMKSGADISNFDPELINALMGDSLLNARAPALTGCITSSTPVSPSMQANFKGLTFVHESLIDMQCRGTRDEDNGIDEDEKLDEDW